MSNQPEDNVVRHGAMPIDGDPGQPPLALRTTAISRCKDMMLKALRARTEMGLLRVRLCAERYRWIFGTLAGAVR